MLALRISAWCLAVGPGLYPLPGHAKLAAMAGRAAVKCSVFGAWPPPQVTCAGQDCIGACSETLSVTLTAVPY